MRIEELNLSVRAYNAVKRAGFDTVEQLLERTPEQLSNYRGIGETLLTEITQKVREEGFEWTQKADCETCLNSRPIVSENGMHSACCLSQKKAAECAYTGKHYVEHPAAKNRTE